MFNNFGIIKDPISKINRDSWSIIKDKSRISSDTAFSSLFFEVLNLWNNICTDYISKNLSSKHQLFSYQVKNVVLRSKKDFYYNFEQIALKFKVQYLLPPFLLAMAPFY